MGQVLYYVPDVGTMKAERACELGLGHVFAEGDLTYAGWQNGPSGPGVLFAHGQAGFEAASACEWTAAPDAAYWIGFLRSDLPRPQDLVRVKVMLGHPVRLADGNLWTVPVIRYIDGATALPRRLTWDGQGWTPEDVIGRHADLFAQLCHAWDVMMAELAKDESLRITISETADLAVRLLQINYRLGPAEVSVLGLLDTQTEGEIVLAGMDWPAIRAAVKKGGLVTPSDAPGGQEDSLDTIQPCET